MSNKSCHVLLHNGNTYNLFSHHIIVISVLYIKLDCTVDDTALCQTILQYVINGKTLII